MALFRRDRQIYETVRSAATRYESTQPGITTWHSFSAAGHYDADNLGYGALIGLDEHLVEPGHGFAEHAHRGVEIFSWVLEGTLRHEDADGRVELIEPGRLLWQSTGSGIRHTETNPSASEPLRFVQLTLLSTTGEPRTSVVAPPVLVPALGLLDVLTGRIELELPSGYLHVLGGRFGIANYALGNGDSAQLAHTVSLSGEGQALLWTSGAPVPAPTPPSPPAVLES